MACTDVTQNDEARCESCGHAEGCCDCFCCPGAAIDADADFAERLGLLALSVEASGDELMARYLTEASDWHATAAIFAAEGLEGIEG
jgi:hypothetical protein